MTITANRYHDISCGHRVYGHENKCAHLHGHNYRVHFYCEAELDEIGRVIDFSVIKSTLCQWLEDNWDHKFLVYLGDPIAETLKVVDPDGVVALTFNPTAENLGLHLMSISQRLLNGTGVNLIKVTIEETRKCSATVQI